MISAKNLNLLPRYVDVVEPAHVIRDEYEFSLIGVMPEC